MSKVQLAALIISLSAYPTIAAETIEAMGGEKCGGAVTEYAVDFLAPENTDVDARVKAMIRGSEDARRNITALSVDGKDCAGARCTFKATKGQTYKFAAKSTGPKVDELCISVSRP